MSWWSSKLKKKNTAENCILDTPKIWKHASFAMDAFLSMHSKLLDQVMKAPGTHHDQNVTSIIESRPTNPPIEDRSACQLLSCQACTPVSSDVSMMDVVVLGTWGKI
jgi:hypothetical protein